MKKILCSLLSLALCLSLAACGNNAPTKADFKSVYDSSAEKLISVGDARADIEAIYGEPENSYSGLDIYKEDKSIALAYDANGNIKEIAVPTNNSDNYVFEDMSYEMSESDVSSTFEKVVVSSEYTNYYMYYDASGKQTPKENAQYFKRISFNASGEVITIAVGATSAAP